MIAALLADERNGELRYAGEAMITVAGAARLRQPAPMCARS